MRDTPRWVGEQTIGATWIGGGPYTGLKTAAYPSLACAQPTRPCDRHGARHFTRASLGRMFVAKRRGRERGIWIMSLGGIGVPAGTPAEIIARLNREINAGLANFADEAALARLLIGAAAIAPAKRRQWVKRIASQLDPAVVHLAPALPGRHGRCLGSTLR